MDDRTVPTPGGEGADPIADAEALFRDDPAPRRRPAPRAAVPDPDPDQYAVEDLTGPARRSPAPPDPAPAGRPPRPGKTAGGAEAPPKRPALDPADAVEQVWSRGAEWGPSLAVLVLTGLAVLAAAYFLASVGQYLLAAGALLAGVPLLAFLCYPIFITLERPVRVTPEQALRDFYTALSHHAPHYKRMWLLLSVSGRTSAKFASYEGFRAYWKSRLKELRAGRASGMTPLKFVVEDYKSEKSAGKSDVDATYTVKVFVRGRQPEGPIESVRVSASLVKGPDRMWYLDRGTLP